MEDFKRQLKRGTLELLLLALIEEKDRYGYEIVSSLEKHTENMFRIKEGTLYPILYRLEDKGIIESYRDIPDRGVPRKYYRLTPTGLLHLKMLKAEWERFSLAVNELISISKKGQEDE